MTFAERELGELKTVSDAQRWLRHLVTWSSAGLLPGTSASANVRAVEVWIRAEESRASFEEVEKLRAAVATLQGERDRLRGELEKLRARGKGRR